MITIRPAVAEDMEHFKSFTNKPTMLAWVGEENDEIVGIGGVARVKGRWIAFCDFTEKARKHKTKIVRTARMVMNEVAMRGIRYVYAEADLSEPCAVKWMKSLGFTLDPRTQYLYRWKNG